MCTYEAAKQLRSLLAVDAQRVPHNGLISHRLRELPTRGALLLLPSC
jgi:hypothetical protein